MHANHLQAFRRLDGYQHFDESPKQLIAEVREPIPVEPGSPARFDTEYERRDLMMICEPTIHRSGFHPAA